jgi:hypothetical protein
MERQFETYFDRFGLRAMPGSFNSKNHESAILEIPRNGKGHLQRGATRFTEAANINGGNGI